MNSRRITALILASAMILSISACKKNTSDESGQASAPLSSASDIDPSSASAPSDSNALPTTVVIPGGDHQNDPAVTDQSEQTAPSGESGAGETVYDTTPAEPDTASGTSEVMPADDSFTEDDLLMFADAATRYYDSPDEIPLTAFEPEEFWSAINTLCVCYRYDLNGVYDADSNEVFYTDDQIDEFAGIIFFDYSEIPDIPDGYAVRRGNGGYAFECNIDDFTPAVLVSTEQDEESVIATLMIEGGDPDTGNDVYKYVRLFAADNDVGVSISNVRTEIAE